MAISQSTKKKKKKKTSTAAPGGGLYWNPAVPALPPKNYDLTTCIGRVVLKGTHGTHLGNNRFVLLDGRLTTSGVTGTTALHHTQERLQTHNVRELAKGVAAVATTSLLNSSEFYGRVMHEITNAFPSTHVLSTLGVQDYVDLLDRVSLSQLLGAKSCIGFRDRDIEARDQGTWLDARGLPGMNLQRRSEIRDAHHQLAARLYAAALQTTVAVANRANEIRQTRLSVSARPFAPVIAVVREVRHRPTARRIIHADATAVLAHAV